MSAVHAFPALATEPPPHDADLELWVAEAVLMGQPAREACRTVGLAGAHFHDAGHGAVYDAALRLDGAGLPVTPKGVIEAMGYGDSAEWLRAVALMTATMPMDPSAVPGAAQRVRSLFTRRGLLTVSRDLAQKAAQDSEPVETLRAAEASLAELAQGNEAGAGLIPMAAIAPTAMAQVETVFRDGGRSSGCPTGLVDLDRVIGGLRPGNLIVVAGRPGMGKSALALNFAANVARGDGTVAFNSLEMAGEQIWQRLAASLTNVGVDRQQAGPITGGELHQIAAANADIAKLPLHIDDGRLASVASIAAGARRLKRRSGLALLVVDYLQLLIGGKAENRVQEISRITRDLKIMAGDLGVPVIAVSQLSRQVESRDDKRPGLADLRDGGSIEQDADQVLFLYRPEYYLREPQRKEGEDGGKFTARQLAYDEQRAAVAGVAEIHVAKNRHGRERTVRAHWDGERQRFTDLARG